MAIKQVSIIINNHNYGHFLEDAISSALSQTYPHTEVIVVDDGSEDDSRTIIEKYSNRIIPVLKECGGQASALNAGFERSRGEIVIFLDSDDRLLPTTAEQASRSMQQSETAKVHWPLWVIDEKGARTGAIHPSATLPAGDFREDVLVKGPGTMPSSPTSGNAWSREFLSDIGPIPEEIYRISADRHLIEIAPFWGALAALSEPQGEYRIHGKNAYVLNTMECQLQNLLAYYDHYAPWLVDFCTREGYQVSMEDWKKNSWWHKQASVIAEMATLPDRPGSIIFVDDGVWGLGPIAGWKRMPFLEQDGQFAGLPENDHQAINELERLRGKGAQYIVFPWHTLWWLEVYPGFQKYLTEHYHQILENEKLVGFDLSRNN